MTRCLTLWVCLYAASAHADAIDDAMQNLEIGELEQARATLASVSIEDRATLARVFEARARIALAVRDDAATNQALRALDALAPEHVFGASAPDELAERLREMDTPRLSLEVTNAEIGTGMSLIVRVDDAAGLAQGTRLRVQVGDQVLESDERTFALPLEPGGTAEVSAELLGEGGVVLERWGPQTVQRAGQVLHDEVEEDARQPQSNTRVRRRRIILGVVIAALVAAAVGGTVGGVFYAKNNRDARLNEPVLID